MTRPCRVISQSGYYHVMQRGIGKQILFEDETDYRKYMSKLTECVRSANVDLVAYCLMPNHIHLLLRTDEIDKMSLLMRRLGTSYASHYNNRYNHVGSVFQGRYRSEPIDSERYLLACMRYIHNNPLKAGIAARENYPWSSYGDYLRENGLANTRPLLSMFASKASFLRFSQDLKDLDEDDFLEVEDENVFIKEGIDIINEKLGYKYDNGFIVKRLKADVRNEVLRCLRKRGLTVKQIELLTGVSAGVIKRAIRGVHGGRS